MFKITDNLIKQLYDLEYNKNVNKCRILEIDYPIITYMWEIHSFNNDTRNKLYLDFMFKHKDHQYLISEKNLYKQIKLILSSYE
jgi:hypothetical protein